MERVPGKISNADAFVKGIIDYAASQLSERELAGFGEFARRFFTRYPLDELHGQLYSDVFGRVYHAWGLVQVYARDKAAIWVFNPNLEEHAWLSPYTQLMVLQRDMPFLVDSIRMELNRRSIAIHTIKSTVMPVVRDGQGQWSAFDGEGAQKEAFVAMEIRHHSREPDLAELRESLASVLVDVELVVADFKPMLQEARSAAENLQQVEQTPSLTGVKESREFLRWLIDNHFTFLGYREYQFVEQEGHRLLCEDTDKRLGIFRLKEEQGKATQLDDANAGVARFHLTPQVINFSKSAVRSRVHRHAYSDYVVVKRFNAAGEVCGESRFLGLYTSAVYTLSPAQIPLLRDKVAGVFERSGLDPASHDGKALQQILDTFPRDELLLSSSAELYETVTGVARINERYLVRLFVRPDIYGKFVSCLVYVPRDVFTTRLRLQVQELLAKHFRAEECEFTTWFSESILARVYMVFKREPGQELEYDLDDLQEKIVDISRSWEDHLQVALHEALGEERAALVLQEYGAGFSAAYKEHFSARVAVQDIAAMTELNGDDSLAMNFYRPSKADAQSVRFKIFQKNTHLELSDVVPVLEHLGLRVLGEHAYEISRSDGSVIWLHDFQLSHMLNDRIDIQAIKFSFQEAFAAIWRGKAESDAFNRLVLGARLSWREVVVLRAYANYMHQTLFNFSHTSIANALVNQLAITRNLIALFKARFDPRLNSASRDKNDERIERLRQKVLEALDAVENLNEDRILRQYLALIEASLRTNYFQKSSDDQDKDYLSIKLNSRAVPGMPEPKPAFEIFVYSPRVEGVHLRGGKVARGGLRWSDRLQDYRTEVLGLVKAQQVKNAVIVPQGAKGGFVCKQPPTEGGREALQKEAITCYQTFIRGLLDLTDNIRGSEITPPPQVVRFDEDDPYLVVAADKGTASFSDIANEISAEYGHWLGDAFASGGSRGYDHKAMGITARGAWVSVQRHFREKGINVQEQDFTAIGIGDMAGDVFGNGMLMSRHICLVAAFNHQHIFIDPTPDAEKSFAERERLFKLPRSSWADYDKSLISEGGGVFNRDAKSIAITSPMRKVFAIDAERLTPSELIHALLKAPVDLLWNGGIGTYVKASTESHADAGDKANDSLRVNGKDLRCKVMGEGGNLGMTQRGRVEYALNGGACNTDFIDNAGGVDCSDHEVNIKILFNQLLDDGDLTLKQRNQLLEQMTEDVARLVLYNNYRQTQAISIAQADAHRRHPEYKRFMQRLQQQGRLDRQLEFLPDDDALQERHAQGRGLTRPELAVLVSYAKTSLKEPLAESQLAEDAYLARFIETAFPALISEKFSNVLYRHRLRKQIVATQVANDLVNTMGISFAQRLMESSGASVEQLAAAYVSARDIFQLPRHWQELEALDDQIPASLQLDLMNRLMRRVRRATRWFLRRPHNQGSVGELVDRFTPGIEELTNILPELLTGAPLIEWQEQSSALMAEGLPEPLARTTAMPGYFFSGLSLVDAALESGRAIPLVARTYIALGDALDLPWFARQIADIKVENHWQASARETYMDDLEQQLRQLVSCFLAQLQDPEGLDALIENWASQPHSQVQRWKQLMGELQGSAGADFAVFSVALRELRELVERLLLDIGAGGNAQ